MPIKNLEVLLSKVILFYSVFYIVMKTFAILFEGVWVLPNIILALPFVILAVLGGVMIKQKNFSWIFVIAGILVIGLVRYYEAEWVVLLQDYFS